MFHIPFQLISQKKINREHEFTPGQINRQLIQYGVALCCVYISVRVETTAYPNFRFHTTTVSSKTYVVTVIPGILFIRYTIQVSHLLDYLFHSNKFKSVFVTPQGTRHNVFSLFAVYASEPII